MYYRRMSQLKFSAARVVNVVYMYKQFNPGRRRLSWHVRPCPGNRGIHRARQRHAICPYSLQAHDASLSLISPPSTSLVSSSIKVWTAFGPTLLPYMKAKTANFTWYITHAVHNARRQTRGDPALPFATLISPTVRTGVSETQARAQVFVIWLLSVFASMCPPCRNCSEMSLLRGFGLMKINVVGSELAPPDFGDIFLSPLNAIHIEIREKRHRDITLYCILPRTAPSSLSFSA